MITIEKEEEKNKFAFGEGVVKYTLPSDERPKSKSKKPQLKKKKAK